MRELYESSYIPVWLSLVGIVLASSAAGPEFNPQSRTALYQRRYKNGTSI